MKELLFSVTRRDLRVDYYRGSGNGGQKRNKTDNCCHITHLESGAVGKSEGGRSKEHNKKTALQRMAQMSEFKNWQRCKAAELLGLDEEVKRALESRNLKIEVKNCEGRWTEAAGSLEALTI